MTDEEFNEEFPPFYAEFRYKSSGIVPRDVDMSRFNMNSPEALNNLGAVLREHATTTIYFVALFHQASKLACFRCSEEEYNTQQIPQKVIDTAQNFQPQLPGIDHE